MLSGISIFCFAASYGVALMLEIVRLFFRAQVRAVLSTGFMAAGLIAHTLYLIGEQNGLVEAGPISDWHHWCLIVAWVLAATYLAMSLTYPKTSLGLFMIPPILLLLGMAYWMDQVAPFDPENRVRPLQIIHGVLLLAGTAAVFLGFATGIMYLIQSYRLKHKMLQQEGFQLPSLEWLQNFNRRTMIVSTCLLAGGLLAGVLLKIDRQTSSFPWSDPVVWSSGILFLWLVAATLFELIYKPARQGQKIAYLTLANFLFLGLVLALILFGPTQHARTRKDQAARYFPLAPIIAFGEERAR